MKSILTSLMGIVYVATSMFGLSAYANAAECGDPATFINVIQGSGNASSEVGNVHDVEGVVVGDFQDTATELRGFFLQEEDLDVDANPLTSEGIFVFDNGFGIDVSLGDVVRVRGTATEFGGLTEIAAVTDLTLCSSGGTASAAPVTLPLSAVSDWERLEGMLINIPQILFATDNFNQGRFGEVDVSPGAPLDIPTNVVLPGAPALALQDLNNRSRIKIDDGSTVQNPLPLPPYLGLNNTLRIGDTIPGLTGVVDERFGRYAIQPTGSVSFTRKNARPLTPDYVGGAFKVASFNTLNYFTTLDGGGSICGPFSNQQCRGADNVFEFVRQHQKIVSALVNLDADIVGLIELENSLADLPIETLVTAVNGMVGFGTYEFIATGPIGAEAIRVGIIYKPASVTPIGSFSILDSSVDPLFIDTKNRPVLAQTFQGNGTDTIVTVAVSHLKSKGSPCDDVGDPDTGDGQGNCNVVRTAASTALVNWLATDPTASGNTNYLIIGDLNAYAQEDPVTAIEGNGYSDLVEIFIGTGVAAGAYSFSFAGQLGYSNHALSSPDLTQLVTGATVWHINADELRALDYNDFNQPLLFMYDQFRASDHDPVIVGICPTTPDSDNDGLGDECDEDDDGDGVVDGHDQCPMTDIPEGVPTAFLRKNRYALTGTPENMTFQSSNKTVFTTADTGGCSCEQIIEELDLGQGHTKFGCTESVMRQWRDQLNP